MAETKIPSIYRVPSKIDPELKRYLESVQEAIEVRLGRRGDELDQAVTFRDLIDSNLAQRASRLNRVIEPIIDDPTPTTPFNNIPQNVRAHCVFTTIQVYWDPHAMGSRFARAEVWSSEINDLNTATKAAGNETGNAWVDSVDYNTTKYYWVRFVERADGNSAMETFGDFSSPAASCTTKEDIGAVMTALSEELSGLPGYTTLINTSVPALVSSGTMKIIRNDSEPSTRDDSSALQGQDIWIDTNDNNQMYIRNAANNAWVEARDGTLVSLVGATSFTGSTISAALATAQADVITVTNAQSSTASSLTSLTAVVDTKARTFIQTSAPTATATGDIWIDSDANNKMYRWNGSAWVAVAAAANTIFTQTSAPTANNTGDIWFDTDDSNKQYRWDGSSWVEVRDVTTQAAVVTEANARATADTANANSITALQASVGEVYGARLYTTDGSNNVKIETMVNSASSTTTANHGLVDDDVNIVGVFLSLKNTVAIGGLTTTQLNKTFKVTARVNATQLQVETVGDAATSGVGPNTTVLDGVTIGTNAGLAQLATVTADIDGNAHASYVLQVAANGSVAGMVLEANAGTATGSAIQFQADKFAIWNGVPTTTVRDFVANGDNVDTTNHTITLDVADYNALYLTTAVEYNNGGGTSIGGLTSGTVYYVIKGGSFTSSPEIKLALTETLANAGTAIQFSSTGSGTHTVNNAVQAPFIISNNNVYIDTVGIKDAAIVGAKIADATITNAHIADLEAVKITSGTINATAVLKIGSDQDGATSQRIQIDTVSGAARILVVDDSAP